MKEEMAGVAKRTYLRDVNPYLICPLCRGYLIDATTVVECLHSFCRSCILKHLNTEAHCPSCKHVINKAKPNIKADKTLQDIVYKLVPGLYHKEMRRRRDFYKQHPEHAELATPEQRGEDVSGRLIFAPEDAVSLSLEYLPPGADPVIILLSVSDTDTNHSNNSNNLTSSNNNNSNNNRNNHDVDTGNSRRYLQCPALVTIAHLKKFLALKYSIDMTRYTIEICHRRAPLPEHWTLMDVAYIYAWKRNAPMRFFYRVAQEEQRLEAPPHERPSTPGLGAYFPPNDTGINTTDDTKLNIIIKEPEMYDTTDAKELSKIINDHQPEASVGEDVNKILSKKTCSPVNCDFVKIGEKDEGNKTISVAALTVATSSTLTVTNTTTVTTTPTTDMVSVTPSCHDSSKAIKSPIKILKNPDGRYEVLKSPPASWNAKEQAAVADVKSTSPEFSVVSIGNGQDSNGVKITLKQCSPTSNNTKKPKVISNVLLRCGQVEKDSSGALVIQQLQKDKDKSPISQDKQEKHRRKVTFMDRPSDKSSAIAAAPKNMRRPVEQQEKNQFLQGFQLTARESIPENAKLKSPIRDISGVKEINSFPKINTKKGESSKRIAVDAVDEIKEKSNAENTNLNTDNNNSTVSTTNIAKRLSTDERLFNSGTNSSTNVSTSSHSKMDVYAFSGDSPIVPAGAVKRKCPPGLSIIDAKRKRQSIGQSPVVKKHPISSLNQSIKLSRNASTEHVTTVNRPTNIVGEHSSVTSVNNAKASTNPMLSNDTRNLLDGCGLSIPASLSITLTAPKSTAIPTGQFIESNDLNNRKSALGKVNPSITLNDRSVDPLVLKALKTGHIRMPTSPKPKPTKLPGRQLNPQRTISAAKQRKEHESREILDLSGGKKNDIHPLRIPQPVTKLKSKITNSRDSLPTLSDQGQVVTLMGGHRYYRAPPGSLTPAAHRVSDCVLPTPSRAPVYAPTGLSLNGNRTGSNLSSAFPSLQSLYALSQAPNLQQFQMDALRSPRTESVMSTVESGDNVNSNINSMSGKSHLAAQCAPIKPARSSIAPLAVPINKQSIDKPAKTGINRIVSDDTSKPLPPPSSFGNNENLDSTDNLTIQARYSSNIENANRFLSRNITESTKNSDQATLESAQSLSTKSRIDSINNDHSIQQPQHHAAASPRVSSTASPSPPPGDNNISARNENSNISADNNTNNSSNDGNNVGNMSSSVKNNIGPEVTSSKSPDSPDSSSITVESTATKSYSSLTDQEVPVDTQRANITKSTDSTTNPDSNAGSTIEVSPTSEDKSKFTGQTDTKQLTSEMRDVQKRILAVFPSNEWANNPIAAEHLGNFLKSLNATMKSEGIAEELKTIENDITRINSDSSVKQAKEIIERPP